MNRRSLLKATVGSTLFGSYQMSANAQVDVDDARDALTQFLSESTPDASLPDYFWEFVNTKARPDLYVVVERFVFDSQQDAETAVFGDKPLVSIKAPIEPIDVIGRGYPDVRARTQRGVLWGQEILVEQVSFAIDNFAWIVTIDEIVSPQPASVSTWSAREFVMKAIVEFGEPRLPRGWTLESSGEID